jgi:hypothetical protein
MAGSATDYFHSQTHTSQLNVRFLTTAMGSVLDLPINLSIALRPKHPKVGL